MSTTGKHYNRRDGDTIMQGFLIKMKRVLLEVLITIAAIAISIVCFILIALFIQKIQIELIHKGDFIVLGQGISFYLSFLFLAECIYFVMYMACKIIKSVKLSNWTQHAVLWCKSHLYAVIPINILVLVISVFTFTVVDDNEIIKYSVLSPTGKSYSLADVDKIDISFDKNGELCYDVVINEKKIDLIFDAHEASDQNRETYEEYLQIDKRIFELNPSVKKEISRKYIDNSGFHDDVVKVINEIIEYSGE